MQRELVAVASALSLRCVSVGYTMDVMYFSWLANTVEVDKAIQLPQFRLRDTVLYDCSQNYTAG